MSPSKKRHYPSSRTISSYVSDSSAKILEASWAETLTLSDDVSVTLPFRMKPGATPISAEQRARLTGFENFGHQSMGLEFEAGFLHRKDSRVDFLEHLPDETFKKISAKAPGIRIEKEITPTVFGGRPAFELAMKIHHPQGLAHYHSISFTDGTRVYWLNFMSSNAGTDHAAIWKRMKDGVVFKSTGGINKPAAGNQDGLPPGLLKRGH